MTRDDTIRTLARKSECSVHNLAPESHFYTKSQEWASDRCIRKVTANNNKPCPPAVLSFVMHTLTALCWAILPSVSEASNFRLNDLTHRSMSHYRYACLCPVCIRHVSAATKRNRNCCNEVVHVSARLFIFSLCMGVASKVGRLQTLWLDNNMSAGYMHGIHGWNRCRKSLEHVAFYQDGIVVY